MRLFRLLILITLSVWTIVPRIQAQATSEIQAKQPRILILLDGSSSMLQPWSDGSSRFKTAGRIITDLMDSIYRINDQVEFSLRVYGHQSPVQQNNCYDTKREVMFSKNNRTQMFLRLSSIEPNGVSPIAFSLKEAAEQDLINEQQNAYSIILITDGGESCNGNICEVVRTLLDKKIFFKPYILSMVDYTPLKQQYDCLGTYLQVAYTKEITPAITTIMESYRKILLLPGIISRPVQAPVVTNTPRPVQVTRPAPPAAEPVKKDTVVVTRPAPPPYSSPVILPKDHISPLPLRRSMRLFAVAVKAPVARKVKPQTYAIKIDPVTAPPPMPAAATPAATVQPTRAVPVPPAASTPAVKPPARTASPASFTVETEAAKETTLEIFFTDGKGTFYKSTPQLQLVDARTGKEVKKFHRTVDAAGNPDPQQIPAGTYDIILSAKSVTLSSGVAVADQKNNKVIIKVSIGSLRFAYGSNPGRPVKEYEAIVTRRFDNLGPSIRQRCTAELDYAPGNYYVEVNTLPITRYNLDIDFGSTTELKLPEPGFVQFTNTDAVGRVSLYAPLGDRYVSFYALDVSGNPAAQQVQLKPGTYEAHFTRSNLPYARESVVKFLIKSNAITEVQLQ